MNASRCFTWHRSIGSVSMRSSGRWTRRNMRIGCADSISTLSSPPGHNRCLPGNEQRGYWGSQAADQPGSRNLAGIKNPAVDTLIDRVIFAKTRQELVAATRALDRVLLWNHYVVPQWTYTKERTLRWNRFWQARQHAGIQCRRFPSNLVVGRGQGSRMTVLTATALDASATIAGLT